MPLINLTHAETFVQGLDHPEDVTLGPDAQIYVGGEAGQVYRVAYDTRRVESYASTEALNLGLALDGDGNVYMCTPGRQAVFRITPAGEMAVYSQGTADRQMVTPNYPAFDAHGYLYVTDSGAWKADNGCTFAIAPNGRTALVDAECAQFPKGCAMSPDGQHLYIAMSLNPPRVVRFRVEAGRKAGPVETVVELPHTVPDGLAFCSDGSLLIACYRPDTIFRMRPGGAVTILMDDYEGTQLGAPTNPGFGGPDRSVLFWGNLGRWHLGMNQLTGLQGAPLFYPRL